MILEIISNLNDSMIVMQNKGIQLLKGFTEW